MPQAPQSSVSRTQTAGEGRDGHQGRAVRRGRRRLGSRIAFGLLVAAVIVFIGVSVPRYLTFDPTEGRLSPSEHPLFFPVLLPHIFGGTVAMSCAVLQIWPWLRRRHIRVHRYAGRVYLFGGVLPASCGALVLASVWPFGPVSALSDIVLASLWLSVTTYGFVLARRRRYADHRRWMLRSFALTISIIFNRLLGMPIGLILSTQVDTMFGGNELAMQQAVSASSTWLPWTLAFITVEWWLDREQRRPARPRASPADGALTGDAVAATVRET